MLQLNLLLRLLLLLLLLNGCLLCPSFEFFCKFLLILLPLLLLLNADAPLFLLLFALLCSLLYLVFLFLFFLKLSFFDLLLEGASFCTRFILELLQVKAYEQEGGESWLGLCLPEVSDGHLVV